MKTINKPYRQALTALMRYSGMLVLTVFYSNVYGLSKDSIRIRFTFINGQQNISKDSVFSTQANDLVRISKLKFYISNCRLKDQQRWSTADSAIYLIDFNTPHSNSITLALDKNFPDSIHFDIGIDSVGNHKGARSGSVDPINGMYWTWQSGFMNTKIEGSMKHESFTRDFQYHIGGYAFPNNALQHCQLPLTNSTETAININLIEFFNAMDASLGTQLMSPGPKAVQLSKLFAKCFQSQLP